MEQDGQVLAGEVCHPGYKVPVAKWVQVVKETHTPREFRGRRLEREVFLSRRSGRA